MSESKRWEDMCKRVVDKGGVRVIVWSRARRKQRLQIKGEAALDG